MSNEKQLIANQQNAQLSTGPLTEAGKAVVSANAIKHGIFTKTLIVSSEIGQESEAEYQAILSNLNDCLMPCNQMESLLVEKIAVDFWRLRRTISFETGSISKHIATLVRDFYTCGTKDNDALDEKIMYNRQLIEWNTTYIEYLTHGKVTFDAPVWKEDTFDSDVIDDLYRVAKSINNLSEKDSHLLYSSVCLSLDALHAILQKYGYNDPKAIAARLIEIYTKEILRHEKETQELFNKKSLNDAANKLTYLLGMAPAAENTDKVLKYERSLQKSIFQNLLMLKKLQGIF